MPDRPVRLREPLLGLAFIVVVWILVALSRPAPIVTLIAIVLTARTMAQNVLPGLRSRLRARR